MAQLNALTQSLTAQQIVTLAERKAGGPGYHLNASSVEALDAPAYIQLQVILDQLALTQDWPFRHDALTLTCASQIVALPLDYWRSSFTNAYLLDSSGLRLGPIPIRGHEDFHDALPQALASGVTGTPSFLSIQKNRGAANGGSGAGQIVFDVAPARTFYLELHYDPIASPLSAISSKPWFPYSQYLVQALLCELYLAQDDTRMVAAASERERLWAQIRRGQSDAGQRSAAVGYDAGFYRAPRVF